MNLFKFNLLIEKKRIKECILWKLQVKHAVVSLLYWSSLNYAPASLLCMLFWRKKYRLCGTTDIVSLKHYMAASLLYNLVGTAALPE